MTYVDLLMDIYKASHDLEGVATLMELSRQRGDSQEKFQKLMLPIVRGNLKRYAEELDRLWRIEQITFEEGEFDGHVRG